MFYYKRVKVDNKAFTLVELLIVIAIIGILASFSLASYLKYREKSILTSHALPVADACAKDVITYCIDLSVSAPTVISLSTVDLPNCRNQNVLGYDLNITLLGTFTCNPGGTVSNGRVEAILDSVPTYKAVCDLNENSINCRVEER
ncbi:MAG: hypothetical protein DSY66_05455 [Persephonella sp.]|nr:MAG: hypothetical protein DSY66_05455 [Persephonella sp.]